MRGFEEFTEECCGTCRMHRKDPDTGEWVCSEPDADYYGMETEYSEPACEEYEER